MKFRCDKNVKSLLAKNSTLNLKIKDALAYVSVIFLLLGLENGLENFTVRTFRCDKNVKALLAKYER